MIYKRLSVGIGPARTPSTIDLSFPTSPVKTNLSQAFLGKTIGKLNRSSIRRSPYLGNLP